MKPLKLMISAFFSLQEDTSRPKIKKNDRTLFIIVLKDMLDCIKEYCNLKENLFLIKIYLVHKKT